MIDQKDYQLLKTIGEQGSVQRAASAIGVSWPSVSKRLAKIEEKLQVTLFERRRGRNGVVPLPVLKSILDEYENFSKTLTATIQEQTAANDDQDLDILRIGIATTIGKADVERALAMLGTVGSLAVKDMSADEALQALEVGETDMALLAEPSYAPIFKSYLVSVDPFQVAFPTGHRFENQNSVQLSELNDENYINRSLCEFPRYFAEQANAEVDADEDHGPHDITNEVVAQIMIQQGYGVAVIPESVVVIQGLRTRALVRPSVVRKIMLVTRADSPVNGIFQKSSLPASLRASG